MMKAVVLGGLLAVVLAGCGALGGLGASEDEQYAALEGQAELTTDLGGGAAAFCDLVRRAINAEGMAYPLAYPVDVLERYSEEHC